MRDGHGRTLPRHECAPRSDMARKLVNIVRLIEGPWQLVGVDEHVSIAIRFCPFCGVDLSEGKPYLVSL